MPVSPSQTWRASWPPTDMRLQPPLDTIGSAAADKDGRDLSLADDSPLSYFLSPTSNTMLSEEDETDYFMDDYDGDESDDFTEFELDAGIEDAAHPLPVVRSVSPSSLADLGLPRPRPRPPTPPRSCFTPSSEHCEHPGEPGERMDGGDDGDDAEPLFNFQLDGRDEMAPAPVALLNIDADDSDSWAPSTTRFLFPALLPVTAGSPPSSMSIRGRPTSRHDLPASSTSTSTGTGTGTGTRSSPGDWRGIPITGRRGVPRVPRSPRSPRSWRVPSPDVFSIEEETEQQLVDSGLLDLAAIVGSSSLKPKKHVRFVLPDEELA